MNLAKALLISARPQQWLKNLTLFAAAFFWGELLEPRIISHLLEAFFVFSFLSSTAYLVNDVLDRKRDRQHPTKKKRPIAAGTLPISTAIVTATILGLGTLTYTYLNFNRYFFSIALLFMLLHLTYSFWVRNVIILDGLWIATAFVLRVYAGAFATPTPISSWLILSVIGLALLLSFGKRRSERTLLSSLHKKFLTRRTLRRYPDTLLDAIIAMSAAYTTLAYSIFAFQTSPAARSSFLAEFLPTTLSSPKWILLTVPLVLYGVARYLYVIYEKKEGESPERVLITDLPLLTTVLLWLLTTFFIVYFLGSQSFLA